MSTATTYAIRTTPAMRRPDAIARAVDHAAAAERERERRARVEAQCAARRRSSRSRNAR